MVGRVEWRVAASGRFSRGVVTHISHIGPPRFSNGVQLIRQRLDRFGINTAGPDGLTIRSYARENEVRVDLTVVPCLRCSGLSTNHGNVIVQTGVARAVILAEQDALFVSVCERYGALELGPNVVL